MIVIDLCCKHEHRFEGWFASAQAFEEQCAQKLVNCPVCATDVVQRLPSAPYVRTRSSAATEAGGDSALPAEHRPPAAPAGANIGSALISVLRQLSHDAENVGERLPEEARRIHYGEAEARNIRGQASGREVEELLSEGILVLPLLPDEGELH